jgi:hypothetical protein
MQKDKRKFCASQMNFLLRVKYLRWSQIFGFNTLQFSGQ